MLDPWDFDFPIPNPAFDPWDLFFQAEPPPGGDAAPGGDALGAIPPEEAARMRREQETR